MNYENFTKDEDNGFLVTGITTSSRSVLNNTESVKVLPSSTTNFIAKISMIIHKFTKNMALTLS